jgi:GH24 family phage-related lysozyme (muramidase)
MSLTEVMPLLIAAMAVFGGVTLGLMALAWRALGIAHDLAKLALSQGITPPPKLPVILKSSSTEVVPQTKPSAVPVPTAPTPVIDPALVAAVKKFEGFSAKAYGDFKQYSIGYGTKATGPDETITEAEAETRLNEELAKAEAAVESFAPNAPKGVKQALTDLTYNSGTAWMKAGLGQLIQAGDYTSAKERILQYNHAGGEVNSGLTKRREAEASWFDNPL